MTEPLSAKLIAEGKCPGWNAWADRYSTIACGKKTTRGDLCGVHDNMRRREQDRKAVEAAARIARAEKAKRETVTRNVVMLLNEKLADRVDLGAREPFFQRGEDVCLSTEDGKRLLDLLGRALT